MKAICISNNVSGPFTWLDLEIGKVYDLEHRYETDKPWQDPRLYYLRSSNGLYSPVLKERFILLEDIREDKLNQIL